MKRSDLLVLGGDGVLQFRGDAADVCESVHPVLEGVHVGRRDFAASYMLLQGVGDYLLKLLCGSCVLLPVGPEGNAQHDKEGGEETRNERRYRDAHDDRHSLKKHDRRGKPGVGESSTCGCQHKKHPGQKPAGGAFCNLLTGKIVFVILIHPLPAVFDGSKVGEMILRELGHRLVPAVLQLRPDAGMVFDLLLCLLAAGDAAGHLVAVPGVGEFLLQAVDFCQQRRIIGGGLRDQLSGLRILFPLKKGHGAGDVELHAAAGIHVGDVAGQLPGHAGGRGGFQLADADRARVGGFGETAQKGLKLRCRRGFRGAGGFIDQSKAVPGLVKIPLDAPDGSVRFQAECSGINLRILPGRKPGHRIVLRLHASGAGKTVEHGLQEGVKGGLARLVGSVDDIHARVKGHGKVVEPAESVDVQINEAHGSHSFLPSYPRLR